MSSLDKFLHLSYPVPPPSKLPPGTSSLPSTSQLFLKGPNDIAFILSAFLCFTVLREVFMRFFFAPIARRYVNDAGGGTPTKSAAGEKKAVRVVGEREMRVRAKAATRFAEQGWSFLYYVVYWSFGMSVFLNSPSYRPGHWIPFDFPAIWSAYPELAISGNQKFYYLTQLAFWFHQLAVLNVEARRKDHWQMFSHHIVTIGLVVGSYLCNVTAIGTVVLVLMDFADILLAQAKMMKYLEWPQPITDGMFGFFLVSWLVTRQIGLLLVTINVYDESPKHISLDEPEIYALGPYDIHYSRTAWKAFYLSLGFLWILICIWFAMICRVAWKVIIGTGAEDTRSDDEGELEGEVDDEEEDEDETEVVKNPVEAGVSEKEVRKRK